MEISNRMRAFALNVIFLSMHHKTNSFNLYLPSIFRSRKFASEKPEDVNSFADKQKTEFFKQFYKEKTTQIETSPVSGINWRNIFHKARRDLIAAFAASAFLVIADHYRRKKNEWQAEREELLQKIAQLTKQLENSTPVATPSKPAPPTPVAPIKDTTSGFQYIFLLTRIRKRNSFSSLIE